MNSKDSNILSIKLSRIVTSESGSFTLKGLLVNVNVLGAAANDDSVRKNLVQSEKLQRLVVAPKLADIADIGFNKVQPLDHLFEALLQ